MDVNKEGKFFVISFYEGLQRVALFTTERRVYKKICESEKIELAEQEISIALQNMGISLVNNTTSQEVSFIGITRYYCVILARKTVNVQLHLMLSMFKALSDQEQ